MTKTLTEAAKAVIARWDSPQWEWLKHGPTADLMHDLRVALDEQAKAQDITQDGPDYGPAWLGVASARVMAQPGIAARHLRDYAALLKAQAQAQAQAEPVAQKCRVCGGSGKVEQFTSATASKTTVTCPFCAGDGKCRTPDSCGPHGCHGGCLPVDDAAAPQPAQPERQPLPRGYLLHWPKPGGGRSLVWDESRIAGDAIGCPVEPVFSFGIGAKG